MKEYKIKYKVSVSEFETYTVYCDEKNLEEKLEELLYHFQAMIDWIGDRPEGQRDYYECDNSILKEFGLLDKNQENEDRIYEAWGY